MQNTDQRWQGRGATSKLGTRALGLYHRALATTTDHYTLGSPREAELDEACCFVLGGLQSQLTELGFRWFRGSRAADVFEVTINEKEPFTSVGPFRQYLEITF